MSLCQREVTGEPDIQAMMALARACRANALHVVDLPYRLSSWALDQPANVGLWADDQGDLLAWAVMQTPFWTIDMVCHTAAAPGLHRRTLAWADARARKLLGTPYGQPCWFVMVSADQAGHIQDLEEAGFAYQAEVQVDPWSRVLLARPGGESLPDCALPAGFTLRPLAGEAEVEAYVALHRAAFGSENMTAAWRARTLRRPEYVPDLDLVAVAPDGRLVAFCVGWLDASAGQAPVGQIEPLGVLEVFRGLGLGHAILSETLRRLEQQGARTVYVETDRDRDAALAVYQAVGFQAEREVLVFRQDFSPLIG